MTTRRVTVTLTESEADAVLFCIGEVEAGDQVFENGQQAAAAARASTKIVASRLSASPKPTGPTHPEAFCQRCRGPNVRTWHAPSPLWNAVMRDPATGHDRYDIVCPACFARLVEEAGFRPIWCFRPSNIDVASLWQDRDGRTWDPDQCLWINADLPAAPQDDWPEALDFVVTTFRALRRRLVGTPPNVDSIDAAIGYALNDCEASILRALEAEGGTS